MQSASRDALATSGEQLNAAADGLGADELRRLAEDLLGVAGILVHEIPLRRALSDPSRSGSDRAGLVERIFGPHVGAPAMSVLTSMVGLRWSSPGDLVDAAEQLGVDAVLIGAEQDGVLPEVEDELFRFSRIADGHPGLSAALADETATAERRGALVDQLLEGKARPATVRLARLAVSGFGGRPFESSLERLIELAAARRDRSVVRVRAAAPMSEQQESGLGSVLAEAYGREVSIQVEVDEGLIGGAIVRIESDLYDGSVASRLAEARRRLTNL